MRTTRIIRWRAGGVFMGVGMAGMIIPSSLWGSAADYSLLGTLMLISLIPAALGAVLIGWALYQVALRELLKRRCLRVRVEAELVSKKKGRNRYCIYARCVSPVSCEVIWIFSPTLLDDPKPYLG